MRTERHVPLHGDGFVKRGWSKFSQDVEKDTAKKMANFPGTNQKQNKSANFFIFIELNSLTDKEAQFELQVNPKVGEFPNSAV